jgi:hypothetical protein
MLKNCTELIVEDYHAHEAWSVSQWKLLPDHPELFQGRHVIKPPLWPMEDTPAMKFGRALHNVLEDPGYTFTVADHCCAKTAKGEPCRSQGSWLWHDEWYCGVHVKGHENAIQPDCMSHEDMAAIRLLEHNAHSQAFIQRLLSGDGMREWQLKATHEATGLAVRGCLDRVWVQPQGYIVADYKTVNFDPYNARLIAKRIHDLRYHWQAAHYSDLATAALGAPPAAFCFLWLQSVPPFNVVLTQLDPAAITLGRDENESALKCLADRLEKNCWTHDDFDRCLSCDLPAYAYKGVPSDYIDDLIG